jgi:hypothetical protein
VARLRLAKSRSYFLSVEWPQPSSEGLGLSEKLQISLEAELAIPLARLEAQQSVAGQASRRNWIHTY